MFESWKKIDKYALRNQVGYQISYYRDEGVVFFSCWFLHGLQDNDVPGLIETKVKSLEEAKAICKKHYLENK